MGHIAHGTVWSLASAFSVLALSVSGLVGCQGTGERAAGPSGDRSGGSGGGPDAAAQVVPAEGPAPSVIVFGSCAYELEPQPIWDAIVAEDPDLFLFVGDNVYMDLYFNEAGERVMAPPTLELMQQAYDDLDRKPGWQALKDTSLVMATWDDHDFGDNDAGKEWKYKDESQAMFEDFFAFSASRVPEGQEGIYHARTFGDEGARLQVIMLDTRYHRDPLARADPRPEGRGPYVPGPGDVLGEAQWQWLEAELRKPADLRIIASSIQVVADEHGWETWGNLPAARDRLYTLIEQTNANGVVFISGDRHLIEISKETQRGPYDLWDFTSSGFNWPTGVVKEDNRSRVGPVLRVPNYGVLRVDWETGELVMEGRGLEGELLMREVVNITNLSGGR